MIYDSAAWTGQTAKALHYWPLPVVMPAPPRVPKPKRKRGNNAELAAVHEEQGRWFYLRDLLERLDEYFTVLRRMKKSDPRAYAYYSQIGGHIACGEMQTALSLPTAWQHGNRPTFGFATFSEFDGSDDSEMMPAVAIYFLKTQCPPTLQYVGPGDVYELTFHWLDEKTQANRTWAFSYFIHVAPDGDVRVPKTYQRQVIRYRGTGDITRHQWVVPSMVKDLKRDIERRTDEKYRNVNQMALHHLAMVAQYVDNATAGAHVRVSRDGLTAVFAIDMLRTPYFFKDRDLQIGPTGKRKKIWHIVRTHKRRLPSGRERYVKTHFRGERRFSWNGYDVLITMPGYHHSDMRDFTAKGVVLGNEEIAPVDMLTNEQVAKRMKRHLNQ